MKNIRFGVILSSRQIAAGGWKVFKDLSSECERLNYHSIWLGDHLTIGSYRLECWTTLSALSTTTSRIRLGTLTLCHSYRNPSLLAKMAASLDVISEGRLEFGIGSGYYEPEYAAYGYPFPKLSVRTAQLEEALKIIKRMWTEDKPSYQGKYYQIEEAICEPKPLQKPHPPITIAGGNEKYTLKLIAKYANRWNFTGSIEAYEHKLDVLKGYCNRIGRDFEEIEKACYFHCVGVYLDNDHLIRAARGAYSREEKRIYEEGGFPLSFKKWLERIHTRCLLGTPEECISKLQDYIEKGVTFFILRFIGTSQTKESLKFFEEVITNLCTV